ncbi:MAG: cob(I)yrinic acid a,c-diamide adenosyltransferase [Candidatus Eisenbacteria sp.]|nr:cob(I)yrinic acid a,c-diamide adenosyltransferase [Candidatus Eisenbacteria bacterium]
MTIYTGSGDKGETSLLSGERVPKSHERIEAYGDVDELNSVLGALVAVLRVGQPQLIREIQGIQSDLFRAGAWLATATDSPTNASLEEMAPEKSRALEAAIDRMEADLPKLDGFILPGGHPAAAWAHVARAVCRRAERRVVGLLLESNASPDATPPRSNNDRCSAQLREAVIYLNRLSDYLFVLARHCNLILGVPDISCKQ